MSVDPLLQGSPYSNLSNKDKHIDKKPTFEKFDIKNKFISNSLIDYPEENPKSKKYSQKEALMNADLIT